MAIDVAQFEEFIKQNFSQNNLPIERCSKILFSQLAHMPEYGGINHPFQFVEREIIHLEGLGKTETKPAAPFKKSGKLSGFMHKHFCVPGYEHLGVNANIAWEFNKSNSKKFSEMALRLAKPYATDGTNTKEELWKYSGELAHAFVKGPGGVLDRYANAEATGDWIIYIVHEKKNYYLCIAKHNQDDFILDALRHSVPEFLFLEAVLHSNAPKEHRA